MENEQEKRKGRRMKGRQEEKGSYRERSGNEGGEREKILLKVGRRETKKQKKWDTELEQFTFKCLLYRGRQMQTGRTEERERDKTKKEEERDKKEEEKKDTKANGSSFR